MGGAPLESGWTEVVVRVPAGWGELVAGVLATGPCGSTLVTGAEGGIGSRDELETVRSALARVDDTPEARRRIRDALARLAEATGEPELAGLEPGFALVPDRDWAGAWRESWKPFRVGRLCVVTPDWDGTPRDGERRLALVPGGTFGTGRHATTRCCLRLVQELVRPGQRVLDVGTGTGILAVAAVLFDAALAVGFDVDPASRPAARDLARGNGVLDRCDFRHGGFEVLGPDDTSFDAVFANLYSDLIQRHADDLAERLGADGRLVVSGCPARHLEPTRAALDRAGLTISRADRRGPWVTLTAHRRIG